MQLLPADEVQVPSANGKEITLLDIATHHSGLPRIPDNLDPADPLNPYADYTVEQMYAFLSEHELRRDPGAKGEYSNLAVGLLGHALALHVGMSYEELLKERILDPLGMADTAIVLTPEMRSRLAQGHNGFGEPTSNWDIPTLAGAGAIRSTVPDMLRFAAASLSDGDEPIHRALRATHAPRRPLDGKARVALNSNVTEPDDVTVTWHNGGTGGYRTFLGLDLEGRRAAVVLSNTSNSVDDIGLHLLDPDLELAKPPAGVEVARAYRDGGIDAALDRARALKGEGDAWRFGEGGLNDLAYNLVSREAIDDAIALLKLNAEFFPDHFNPHDSLGEFYMMKGETALAIEHYRKSLELNPENDNAVSKLAELEAES
jgi:CubicO group peptidase (beta-lactamase class C family)